MGIITNGSVSGVLPDTETFAIHYPGYPSSTARAIETLGGTERIAKALAASLPRKQSSYLQACIPEANYLELRFRPEDPYSHPAFGDLRSCTGLLLKISKNKKLNNLKDNVLDKMPEGLSACTTLNLVSICEMENNQEEGAQLEGKNVSNSGELNGSEHVQASKGNHQDVLVSDRVPSFFSTFSCSVEQASCFPDGRKDGPENIQPDGEMITNEGLTGEMYEDASTVVICGDIVARVHRAFYFDGMVDYQHVLSVHAEVTRRKKRRWVDVESQFERHGLMDIDQEDLMMLVPPLFSRKDIPENLVLKPTTMSTSKRRLEGVVRNSWEVEIEPCIAIDFSIQEIPRNIKWENHVSQDSGHWEWQNAVAKLFDERPIWPRLSLHERLLKDGWKISTDQIKRLLFRVAYYFATGPYGRFWIRKAYDPRKDPESRIYQRVDFRVPALLRSSGGVKRLQVKHTWDDLLNFKDFPSKSFVSLQLFELIDDYIQEEIRKPTERQSCSHSTGWFSRMMFECLKLQVSIKFLSLIPNSDGAKELLKERSERFRRLQILKKEYLADKKLTIGDNDTSDAPQLSQCKLDNAEPTCDTDKDEPDDDEYEDEEDEEEGLDGYGSQDGDDAGFSMESNYYSVAENRSDSYLQELLRGFPFATAEANAIPITEDPDTNIGDGDYQIYEPDSDDDHNYYSDEDENLL